MFREGCQVAKNTHGCENMHSFLDRVFIENRAKIDRKMEENSVCSKIHEKMIRGPFLGPPFWPTEAIFRHFLDPKGSLWAPLVNKNTLKVKKRIVHRASRGTLRRPRIPQYGFRIDFSWFWVLQRTPGNDLGSIFGMDFQRKINQLSHRF